MIQIYLAGPHGFSEFTKIGVQSLKNILQNYAIIIDPFQDTETQKWAAELIALQDNLLHSENNCSNRESYEKILALNTKIAARNEDLLNRCDIIFAILDGCDVDSGTAAEIGYGYAQGKTIFGYRGDFRKTGDNLGSTINLQVEYFIMHSGGKLFSSLHEIGDYLTQKSFDSDK